jgi:hypothetical protein
MRTDVRVRAALDAGWCPVELAAKAFFEIADLGLQRGNPILE